MKKTTFAKYAERLRLYDKLVATNSAVQRKGATVPYTSLNGHMFSYLGKSGELALRLPPEALPAFLKQYKTRPLPAVWRRAKRVCNGSQSTASEDGRIEKVFQSELRVRQFTQTETEQEGKDLTIGPRDVVRSFRESEGRGKGVQGGMRAMEVIVMKVVGKEGSSMATGVIKNEHKPFRG
jgi:hypothetical protein